MIGAHDQTDFHTYLQHSYIYPDDMNIQNLVNRMNHINHEFQIFG